MKLYPATHDQIIDHIVRGAAFARTEDAERAARIVLEALRERLADNEADAVARDLPPKLASAMRSARYRADFSPSDLYATVHQRASVSRAIGLEETQVVLHAVGDALSDDTRTLLERELPREWTELLFEEREQSEPPPYAAPRVGPKVRRTLSSGHPGFKRSIAESQPETAHTHSVARSDAPHADTKISSGHPQTRR